MMTIFRGRLYYLHGHFRTAGEAWDALDSAFAAGNVAEYDMATVFLFRGAWRIATLAPGQD